MKTVATYRMDDVEYKVKVGEGGVLHGKGLSVCLFEARLSIEKLARQVYERDRIIGTLPTNSDGDVIILGSKHWFFWNSVWGRVVVFSLRKPTKVDGGRHIEIDIEVEKGSESHIVKPQDLFTEIPKSEPHEDCSEIEIDPIKERVENLEKIVDQLKRVTPTL